MKSVVRELVRPYKIGAAAVHDFDVDRAMDIATRMDFALHNLMNSLKEKDVNELSPIRTSALRLRQIGNDLTDLALNAERYRHKKRGTSYRLICTAHAQCETPIQDMETVLLYRGLEMPYGIYFRRATEFYDGRFEKI